MDLQKLQSFYENEGLEEMRLHRDSVQYLEFITASRYMKRWLPPGCSVLDSCAGSGVYAFALAAEGHAVTAGDIVPFNVRAMREKQAEDPLLAEVYEGDALDLSRFADASFDAALCMGALYHLHEPWERKRAMEECARVLKADGSAFFTYMNRYAVILNNVGGSLANIEEVLSFAREGHEGIFYASTPEEMTALAAQCGLVVERHVALDGLNVFLSENSGVLNAEGARRWQEYHLATCEVPSLLGYSYHNMLICRKQVIG